MQRWLLSEGTKRPESSHVVVLTPMPAQERVGPFGRQNTGNPIEQAVALRASLLSKVEPEAARR